MNLFSLRSKDRLRNQSGQWQAGLGALLQGFSQGAEKAQQRARQREEMEHRKKELDLRIKLGDLQARGDEHKLRRALTQEGALESLAQQVGGETVTPTEGPATEQGVGPAPVTTPSTDPGQRIKAALIRSGNVGQAFEKPQLVQEGAVGTLQGSQFQPFQGGPAGGGALDAKGIAELYGLAPEIAARVASLPPKAQERTLDNLRTQKAQEAQTQRFEQGQASMEGRFQRGQEGLESRFQRGLESRQGQDKPLPPQIQNALNQAEEMLVDVQTAKELHKGSFTGPIQGRLGGLRSATGIGLSSKESDFKTITAKIRNRVRSKEFGAALTQYEGGEALREVPEETQPDQSMISKLNLMESTLTKNIERIKRNATTPRSQMQGPASSPSRPLEGGRQEITIGDKNYVIDAQGNVFLKKGK